eukprot:4055762-Amphidinium_carterae.1
MTRASWSFDPFHILGTSPPKREETQQTLAQSHHMKWKAARLSANEHVHDRRTQTPHLETWMVHDYRRTGLVESFARPIKQLQATCKDSSQYTGGAKA